MVKQFIPLIGFIFLLSSCTVFKSLKIPGNQQAAAVAAPTTPAPNKFIDEITVTAPSLADKTVVKPEPQVAVKAKTSGPSDIQISKEDSRQFNDLLNNYGRSRENVSTLQVKYADLLDMDVESLPSNVLLDNVDDWYGVRYRSGGNTKSGVDCSGFTVAIYAAVYGLAIPRVSRDQYRTSRKISTTELEEGDLVFFNTRGHGVSHVGIYLGNNRFIHASVSRGVMVSSLFDSYYLHRFVGAGRIDDKRVTALN